MTMGIRFLLRNDDNNHASIEISNNSAPPRNPNVFHFRLTFETLSSADDDENDTIATDTNATTVVGNTVIYVCAKVLL